jgi:hypothetical protein
MPPVDLAHDLNGDLAAPYLDLSTGWKMESDGQNTTDPTVTLGAASATQVTVSSVGGPGCGCNAQVLTIPLPSPLACASATLEFKYTTTAAPNAFSFNNTSALYVQFLDGATPAGSFSASEQAGHSNCALLFNNMFPQTPQLKEGLNQIALGSLIAGSDGSCGGIFDTIVVHLEASGCATTDTSNTTLSNLRVY